MREITDVKEVQEVLRGLLAHFKQVCREHGLTFFLSNGSLLGAVKYEGFIPWDDDADVLMPREDYERFLQLPEAAPYRLLCRETVPGWRVPYAKLTDTRTVLREGPYDFGTEAGVSLDIFPLDRWHPHRRVARWQARYANLLKRMLVFSNAERFSTERQGVKRLLLRLLWAAGRLMGTERLNRALLALAKRQYPQGYVGCVVWCSYGTGEVLPAAVFAEQMLLSFCGEEYPVPRDYDRYLTCLYGAWRQELPPARQKSNHRIQVWWKDEER